MFSFLASFCVFVGFFALIHLIWYFFKSLYAYFANPVDLKTYLNAKWVLITGASSGVGWELALQCADQGVNVVALGRNEQRLNDLKSILEAKKVECRTFSKDLSDPQTIPAMFKEDLNDIKINAVFSCHGGGMITRFENYTNKELIDYNNAAITSNILLAQDFIRQCPGKGSITYVSSANEFFPTPFLTQYGSVKHFITHFGDCIKLDGYYQNISVQVVNPGQIAGTRFFDTMPEKLKSFGTPGSHALKPSVVARMLLSTVGTNFTFDCGIDCWLFRLISILPFPVSDLILKTTGKVINQGLSE